VRKPAARMPPEDSPNPHAAFDEAGAGNVAWSRCCDTRTERARQQGTQTST
jgi:hypothetical protein